MNVRTVTRRHLFVPCCGGSHENHSDASSDRNIVEHPKECFSMQLHHRAPSVRIRFGAAVDTEVLNLALHLTRRNAWSDAARICI